MLKHKGRWVVGKTGNKLLDETLRWLHRRKCRLAVFRVVQVLNKEGVKPNATQVIRLSGEDWCRSSHSNASEAIRQLIKKGCLANQGKPHLMALTEGPLWGVISDQLEEQGKPRINWLEDKL